MLVDIFIRMEIIARHGKIRRRDIPVLLLLCWLDEKQDRNVPPPII